MGKATDGTRRPGGLGYIKLVLVKELVYWPRTIGLRLTVKQSVQLAVILLAMLALGVGTVHAIATGTWDPAP